MWTLGIHLTVLPLAIAQCGIVILARLRMDSWNYSAMSEGIPSPNISSFLTASTPAKDENKYYLISDHDPQTLHEDAAFDDLEDGKWPNVQGGPRFRNTSCTVAAAGAGAAAKSFARAGGYHIWPAGVSRTVGDRFRSASHIAKNDCRACTG